MKLSLLEGWAMDRRIRIAIVIVVFLGFIFLAAEVMRPKNSGAPDASSTRTGLESPTLRTEASSTESRSDAKQVSPQSSELATPRPALALDADNCAVNDSLARQSHSTPETRRAFAISLSMYINGEVGESLHSNANEFTYTLTGGQREILEIRADHAGDLLRGMAQDDRELKRKAQYCAIGFAQVRFWLGDELTDVINIDAHDADEYLRQAPSSDPPLVGHVQMLNVHNLSLQRDADKLDSLNCHSPEILKTLSQATINDRVEYVRKVNDSLIGALAADKISFVDGGDDGEVLIIFAPSYIAPTLLDKIVKDPEKMSAFCLYGFARLEMWTGSSTVEGKLMASVDTDPVSTSAYVRNQNASK
jgi:hypothetical protein